MWTETRLKFLAAVPIGNGLGEAGVHDDPAWPRYVRTTDIAGPRALRTDAFASLPPEVAAKATLRRGDLLMTAAGATIGKSYLHNSDAPACYAGYLVRFRARPDVDARFIAYWTESAPYWNQIHAGRVISTIENFSAGRYRNLRLRVPPLDDQRHIADFLDAATERIDALIEKKQRMVTLLAERVAFEIESGLRSMAVDQGEIPLRHLADLTVGIVVTPANWYADEGVPALRGVNILPGQIRLDDLVYISHEGHVLHPKSRLRPGDVVTVRTGQAGTTAVIPPELDDANCIDLLLTRPRASLLPEFLELVINSDWCRKHIEKHAVGAIQGHFNVGALKGLPIPCIDTAAQAAFVARIGNVRQRIDRLSSSLLTQISILGERRRALITAAVTGHLEVAKAAA